MFFLPLDPLAAVLLVAKRSQIVADRINRRPPLIVPVISGSGIVSVDFDRVTSRIYWADASQKKIWSAYQNGTDRREVSQTKGPLKSGVQRLLLDHMATQQTGQHSLFNMSLS